MAIFAKLKAKFFNKKDNKYDQGLQKSRLSFTERLKGLSAKYQTINPEYFEALEEVLISADVGHKMAMQVVHEIAQEAKRRKITQSNAINDIILDKLFAIYTEGEIVSTRLNFNQQPPTCFLIIGVNGSGKTTTLAKLAYQLKALDKKPFLIAGDTFRAGAVEQLKMWAQKIGVSIQLPTKPQQDPASVVYQGLEQAIQAHADVILIDTAGRLENKVNLMQELSKINKIIKQKLGHDPDEVLLVLDATTGQNGIIQAQEFAKIVPVSAVVLTKMDGTAKGGVVLAIKEYLDLPVKLIGLGEKAEDLAEFDLDQYLYNLTKDLFAGANNE